MPVVSCEIDGQPGYRWGSSGKCYTFEPGDVEGMKLARSRASAQGAAAYAAGYEEAVKLPSYVISALKKGLDLHRDGKSGEGLRPATVRSATQGVETGEWPEDKIVKAAAWLARHDTDRDLKGGADWSDPPTPGYTAWLLWGDSGDGKGWSWIKSKAAEIKAKKENADDKSQSTPAPPEDRIKGGKNTGKGTAKSSSPEFGDRTNVALKRMVKGHNDSFGDDPRKKATLPMLRKVYLRGAGAYSTSHRPGVTRAAWAFGRVKAFLKMLKNLKPDDPKYNGPDNDLLPAEHPLSSKKREAQMNKNEGGYYRYEGHTALHEANWGMKFVALRHALGEMLHFYMAKEISDDDVAAKYIEDMGSMIDAAKKMPEYGEAAKSSFYMLMSMVSESLRSWVERDANTAGGMMYYSLRSIQDRFEKKMEPRRPEPKMSGYDYDESDAVSDILSRASLIAEEIGAYLKVGKSDIQSRAKLERHADSAILIAENVGCLEAKEIQGLKGLLSRMRGLSS